MNTKITTSLRAYASRLLIGTGLTPDTAHRAASGTDSVPTDPITVALRDGWTSAGGQR